MSAVNEVTARLQASHEALRGEVTRLTRELGEANAQVERSRRLAALGEMAAGIAHEVRNPLGSIRLYAGMLEQDLPGASEEHRIASRISGAVRVVEGIVGDVLTFAKEFKLRPAEISVPEAFDRALEACRHDGVAGWRGVDVVRLDRADGALGCIYADANLLQQALVNLVRNAFEAMAESPGGTHRLTLDARTRRVAGADGRVRPHGVIVVTDTGPGVSPDVVARMFNPFFTTRGQGTGLGLSIVHRIIDAHAGRITVRNNSEAGGGPGACAEIALPLDDAGTEPAGEFQNEFSNAEAIR